MAVSPFRGLAMSTLAVPRELFRSTVTFYAEALGMSVSEDPAFPDRAIAGFAAEGGLAVELLATDGAAPTGGAGGRQGPSGYWKIGVGLPDVNAAVGRLQERGVAVKPGSQFLDVGFLTHLADPAGNSIELLQDTFESNFKPTPLAAAPLACEVPKVGQLTLKVSDIEKSLAFYRDALGMRLLCAYDVGDYGFRLYFLAFTEETPPSAELGAVENREWTYSLPYTTLELFTKPAAQGAESYTVSGPDETGWRGLTVAVTDAAAAEARLAAAGVGAERLESGELRCIDPDGFPVTFLTSANAGRL